MAQGNVSQHLTVLRGRRLVSIRKEANRVFYSLRDPILGQVLAQMRRYTGSLLDDDLALLRELRGSAAAADHRPRGRRRHRR